MKIDMTTGDQITPAAEKYTYHSNITDSSIEIWAYTLETILAEKMETVFRRGTLNTRLRDFYDIYILTTTCADTIDPKVFKEAFKATAKYRGLSTSATEMHLILDSIENDSVIRNRWDRYSKEYSYARNISFLLVMESLRTLGKWITEEK